MIKQLRKIDGSVDLTKNQQKEVNGGGLTLYISSCSPVYNGAPCKTDDGHDGTCSGFVCSPNCVH